MVPESDRTYSCVVFSAGAETGVMQMLDATYNYDGVLASIHQQCGVQGTINAVLQGLSEDQVLVLGSILSNLSEMQISSNEQLRGLLTFSFQRVEMPQVRVALQDHLDVFFAEQPQFQEKEHWIRKLIDLYVTHGNNPNDYTQAAEAFMADEEIHTRCSCLNIFHILMYEILPEVRARIEQGG